MEELRGFTHIDTLYELKGLQLAQNFYDLLFPVVAAVILALGVVRALHVASQEHRFRDLVFYIVYAIFMLWLVAPIEVGVAVPAGYALQDVKDVGVTFDRLNPDQGDSQRGARVAVKAPRVMVWTHIAIDSVQALMVDKVNETFRKQPYASSRIALSLRTARIHDGDLRDRYYAFLVSCYLPILANRRANELPAPDRYYNPFALAPDGSVSYAEYRPYAAFDKNGNPVVGLPDQTKDRTTWLEDGQKIVKDIKKEAKKAINFLGNAARKFLGKSQPVEAQVKPRPLSCETVAARLHVDIFQHLRLDPNHLQLKAEMGALLEELGKKNEATAPNWNGRLDEIVLEYVLYNETLGTLSMREIQNLQAAIPEYGVFKTSQQTETSGKYPNPFSGKGEDLLTYVNPVDWFSRAKDLVSFVVKAKQSVDQWIQHRAEAPAMYYKVTCYAPYMYGIAVMILISLFPFAAFFSLLPGKWQALLVWAKYLLWVKLWMVLWAVLAKFNEWRDWEDLQKAEAQMGDVTQIWPGIVAMYLVVPALSLIAVQILSAGAKGISGMAMNLTPSGGSAPIDVWSKVPSPSGGGGGGGGGGAAEAPPPVA